MSRVPRIRFKGFEEDWEQRKLVNLCEKFTDGDWIEAKDQSHSGVRLIQTGNVGLGEYIDKPDNKKWISEETFVLLNCEEVLAGDILISRLPEPAGRACIVPSLGTKIIAAVDCTIVRVATKINPKYLLQYLSSQSYFDEVNTCLAGGTRQRISRSNLADFDIPIPAKYEEQKAIGEFLFCIDHLITLHQSKSFGYIFKAIVSFTLYWEQRKLGEFGKATGGISIESEFDEHGKYKVISIGSYSEESKYTDQGIRVYKTKKTESRILNKNDLVMILNDKTSSGNIIGRVLLVDKDNTYVYNQRTERIEINKSKFLPEYLYQLLNSDNIREKIICASQGNTQIYVNWTIIREFTYKITTDIEEQGKIARFFISLDHLITLHQLEPFQLIFKAIAYRIIDYAKSKPPRHTKYEIIISFIKCYV